MYTIKNAPNNLLAYILSSLDVKKYDWHIIPHQTEVWADKDGSNFFDSIRYSGEQFFSQIQESHYIVFLKLQAYDCDCCKITEIHTYEDFLSSDCQILVLINDCDYVEIYLKDEINIDNICNNIKGDTIFEDVVILTSENNDRNKLDVL